MAFCITFSRYMCSVSDDQCVCVRVCESVCACMCVRVCAVPQAATFFPWFRKCVH